MPRLLIPFICVTVSALILMLAMMGSVTIAMGTTHPNPSTKLDFPIPMVSEITKSIISCVLYSMVWIGTMITYWRWFHRALNKSGTYAQRFRTVRRFTFAQDEDRRQQRQVG